MDDNQIKELVIAAQVNEQQYLNAALEANEGALVHVASKVRVSGLTFTDIKTSLKIAAIKAIRDFDASMDRPWAPFMFAYLKNAVRYMIKHAQNKERWRINDFMVNIDEVTINSPISVDNHCVSMELHEIMKDLSTRNAVMLELRYLHHWTLGEIAKAVGISGERVRQLMQFSCATMRDKYSLI